MCTESWPWKMALSQRSLHDAGKGNDAAIPWLEDLLPDHLSHGYFI